MTFADEFIKVLTFLGYIIPALLAFGAGWKYLPVIRNVINEGVIPCLNAAIVFLTLVGGGAATAHAGIFGDVGKVLAYPAALAASLLISEFTSKIHDRFLKPLLPKSPYTKLLDQRSR